MNARHEAAGAVAQDAPLVDVLEAVADAARLRHLAGIELDDPELHARVSVIAERTASRLGRPVGLVTLVLDSAQYVLGSSGLDGWIIASGGTPVEWSFCARAVASRAAYVVNDALADPIQQHNPLVTIDGIRSYAGVPLLDDTGTVLGAHCVIGTSPHEFDEHDLAELAAAASEVVAVIAEYRRSDRAAA